MNYDLFASGGYYDRDFFGNIWNNILCVDAKAEKKLESFPVSFNFGLHGIWDRTRDFTPTLIDGYNPGKVAFDSDWKNTLTFNASFGAHLYY